MEERDRLSLRSHTVSRATSRTGSPSQQKSRRFLFCFDFFSLSFLLKETYLKMWSVLSSVWFVNDRSLSPRFFAFFLFSLSLISVSLLGPGGQSAKIIINCFKFYICASFVRKGTKYGSILLLNTHPHTHTQGGGGEQWSLITPYHTISWYFLCLLLGVGVGVVFAPFFSWPYPVTVIINNHAVWNCRACDVLNNFCNYYLNSRLRQKCYQENTNKITDWHTWVMCGYLYILAL